jgi:hypothetical protein
MTRYQLEQLKLENQFVTRMLLDHGIIEITTKRQAKNGTRAFRMPTGQILASYKSGYVRRCDRSDRVYQLNPQYQQNQRFVWMKDNGDLYTKEDTYTARALIYSPIARLKFITNYYLKNFKTSIDKSLMILALETLLEQVKDD